MGLESRKFSHFSDEWNIIRQIEGVINFSSKLGINSRALALGRKGVGAKSHEKDKDVWYVGVFVCEVSISIIRHSTKGFHSSERL